MNKNDSTAGVWARSFNSASSDRRYGKDRRRLTLKTFVYGSLKARRRSVRRNEGGYVLLDWHEPRLFLLSVAVLSLSLIDALFTSTLLARGAFEANPFLAYLLEVSPRLFAFVKMGLTGGGIIVLVACYRIRLFRAIRVGVFLPGCVLAYSTLIGYEWWLLQVTA